MLLPHHQAHNIFILPVLRYQGVRDDELVKKNKQIFAEYYHLSAGE